MCIAVCVAVRVAVYVAVCVAVKVGVLQGVLQCDEDMTSAATGYAGCGEYTRSCLPKM